ncbi:MAG: hypothetical protein KAW89_10670 [Armatimonadetes bacterium]|nr:hypothetical protein [Armatimonadota bacterium]
MKRRQPHYRESDEEAIKKRREAIVDRALLYAHLLSMLDERSKEDDGNETAVAENDEEVSQQTKAKQQRPTGPAPEAPADAGLRVQ